jgi:hypothetical protein
MYVQQYDSPPSQSSQQCFFFCCSSYYSICLLVYMVAVRSLSPLERHHALRWLAIAVGEYSRSR